MSDAVKAAHRVIRSPGRWSDGPYTASDVHLPALQHRQGFLEKQLVEAVARARLEIVGSGFRRPSRLAALTFNRHSARSRPPSCTAASSRAANSVDPDKHVGFFVVGRGSRADCQSSITAYARHGRHGCDDDRVRARCSRRPCVSKPGRRPRNASGSLKARINTYWVVQSPIPGMARSCAAVETPSNTTCSSINRSCQRAESVARARNAGFFDGRIGQLRRGWKQSRASPLAASIGVPHCAATRPAIVVAAATEICWPRIALTASSNGSQAPGVRTPGWAARLCV